MKVQATYKDIWRISYPIMLGSLATTVLNLTDTAFIARVGETELAAMAITTVYYFVMVMIAISLGIGSQIIMARRAGEGNHAEIGKLFDHTIVMLSILGILCFGVLYFLSEWFFGLILKSEVIVQTALEYMLPRSYGIFISTLIIAFRSFFIGISQTRVISYSAFLMLVLNACLDYVLIFGHYGFPAMGLKGAAIASVISEFVAFLYLVIFTLSAKDFKQYRLFTFTGMNMERIRAIFNLASPVVLQNTLSMGAWFMFFVFIEHMGERALAISNIIRSTYMVLMTPIWGLASATNSMVSNIIGQDKAGEVKSLVGKIINFSFLTTFIVFAVSVISPQWILRIVTNDQGLIEDSVGSYYIIIGAMFLFSVSIILLSTVSGSGNTRAAMIIELINISIYVIYAYICVFVFNGTIEAVWFTEILYWIFMGLFSWYYLKIRKWSPVKI